MNLLSSLLKYTADQIAALRAKDTAQDGTVSGINTRLGTAENNITTLAASLDTAISAVTTDTEVTDIRVGADGVTETTAGKSVRRQIANLNPCKDAVFGTPVWEFNSNGSKADSNYWRFGASQISLTRDKKYKFELTPNTTFTQDSIQVGTSNASADMVATLGTSVAFTDGVAVSFEYTPTVDGIKSMRIYGNAAKIASLKVYVTELEGGLIADLDALEDTVDAEVSRIDTDIHGTLLGWEHYWDGSRASLSNVNYWRFCPDYEPLTKDVKYRIRITPNATFTQDSIQVGTAPASADMVATLGTNVSFTNGVAVDYQYTPTVSDVKNIRIIGNADKIASIETFVEAYEGGIDGELRYIESENHIPLIARANGIYARLNKLKSDIERSMPSILSIKNGEEQVTKTITIPSVGAKSKYILPIRMHYESARFNPQSNDVFFDKSCNKDFSDVRFFDANGKMLKASLGEAVNLDFLIDTSIYAYPKLFPLSNGYCVASFGGSDRGIYISRSQCHNWTGPISGTSNVDTEHPSDVNGYVSMFVVGVDSNDNVFAYAGGKLYKLVAGADYSYSTITEVLDFTWTDTTDNNKTIYPDIQPNSFAIDGDGRMYIGLYQKQYMGCVYVSTDGGDNWTQKYVTGIGAVASDYHQHVHQIVYDSHQDKVYVCIDDGNSVYNGAFILTTTDGGETWTDITENISGSQGVRGKDYYPCYCGNGYRLGSGETYILGGACTIRSEDDVNFDHVIKGFAATRSIVDFGDDSVLIAGSQVTINSSENQILVSYDKGKTWKTVSRIDQAPLASGGGGGYRWNLSATQFAGETEPCCILTNSETSLNLKRTRVYKGGDHYFREAYILLEDIPSGDIVITAKTGYSVEYPYHSVDEYEVDNLVYRIPFDEGSGLKASDSNGKIVNLPIHTSWDSYGEPVRCGEFGGNNRPEVIDYHSAIKFDGRISFGKVGALNFNKNYTLTFWINEKGRLNNYDPSQRLDMPFSGASAENVVYKLMRLGSNDLVRYNNYIGFIYKYDNNDTSKATFATFASAIPFCDDYNFVAIEVNDGSISVSVNGSKLVQSTINNNLVLNVSNLSIADIIVGSSDCDMSGYIGDIKIYSRLLSENELVNLYKGYQFK